MQVLLHKESRLLYYARHGIRACVPAACFRRRLNALLHGISDRESVGLYDRMAYYNRITQPFELGADARPFRPNVLKGRSLYHIDLAEPLRFFDPHFRVAFQFGDVTEVPGTPTLVKSRPIRNDNQNGVLLNLNRLRHFVFVEDPQPFESKRDQVVWRGRACQEHRKAFLRKYYTHPRCDVGHYHRRHRDVELTRPHLSIAAQLRFKFVLGIEGFDVASNLKWILSSNSLCLMTQPRYETWFMEGRLIAGEHYVQLRDDYADLIEKIDYYATHAGESVAIIRAANQWVAQMRDPDRERRIALLVLWKYFHDSGQLAGPPPPGYPGGRS